MGATEYSEGGGFVGIVLGVEDANYLANRVPRQGDAEADVVSMTGTDGPSDAQRVAQQSVRETGRMKQEAREGTTSTAAPKNCPSLW